MPGSATQAIALPPAASRRRRPGSEWLMTRLKASLRPRSNRRRGQRRALLRAPRRNRFAERRQRSYRVIPADAGVGDALAVDELRRVILAGGESLRAFEEMAFDHDAEDA